MIYTESEYIDAGYRLAVLTNGSAIAARTDLLHAMLSREHPDDVPQARRLVDQGRAEGAAWWASLPPYRRARA